MLLSHRTAGYLAVLAVAISGVISATCPSGWYEFRTNCYYYGRSKVNWSQARDICRTRGGVLATITSDAEFDFMRRMAQPFKPDRVTFHVGVTDAGTEGTWRNIDGKPFTLNKNRWSGGQPDNYGKKEHCGSLRDSMAYKLNDAPCGTAYGYICKRSSGFPDACDTENGWHLINGRCYKFNQNTETWSDSRKVCQESDADLLAISNLQELNFVSESVACTSSEPIWLGVSDTLDKKTMKWVDGKTPAANLLKWEGGNPDTSQFAKGHNCGAVIPANRYKWAVSSCEGDRKRFICEKDKGQCPSGWKTKGTTCYKMNNERISWVEARQSCSQYNARLAQTATEVNDAVPGGTAVYWIEMSDKVTDGEFADLSGAKPDASVWNAGYPASGSIKGRWDCAVSARSSKLSLQSCFNGNSYICVADQGAITGVPTTPPSDGLKCYPGWNKFGSKCYMFNLQNKNYNAAKADCKNMDASLLKIDDEFEQGFISAKLRDHAWIGFDDLQTTGQFKWNDGSNATFLNWNKNEPNNVGGKEHCAEAAYSASDRGGWNDLPCDVLRDYICEKDAVPGEQITSPKPTKPWSPLCGPGWVYSEKMSLCYMFDEEWKTWLDAQKSCEKLNSDLISIVSKEEYQFLEGLRIADPAMNQGFWIGASDIGQENGWTWSDGQPFRFLNWNAGEPNNFKTEEDCAEVNNKGKWNDLPCTRKRPFVCKKQSDSATTVPSVTTPIPLISDKCTTTPDLISGDHWVPDSSLTALTSNDNDSGPENSRIDWTTADTKVILKTKDEYKYLPAVNMHLRGITSITFTVKACNDAHISLQPAADGNITRSSYEIVIGGWAGTQSAIRKQHQSGLKVKYNQPTLDCQNVKPFWISWTNGNIAVGRGDKVDGSTQFMAWQDPNPWPIGGIAVSTGWGSSGEWTIINPHGTRLGAWRPKYSPRTGLPPGTEQTIYSAWLQVDFLKPTLVQSVTTKGRSDANEYVTSYSISYSYDDPLQFEFIRESSSIKYFAGNKDNTNSVTNSFDVPFEAQYVRLNPRKFISFPSVRWSLAGCPSPQYCKPERLVTGAARVTTGRLVASSIKSNTIDDARLTNTSKGWVASTPAVGDQSVPNEWIQARFDKEMMIYGVVTQGNANNAYWVTSYQLQFRSPGEQWTVYQEPYGYTRTFTANTDQNTAVTNVLLNPVKAVYIRIYPRGYQRMISMRFDVLGCLSGCQTAELLAGERPIDDKRFSASSQMSGFTAASRGRLNLMHEGSMKGAWVAKNIKDGEFLQVDFGITEQIRAIATQGREDADMWVSQYKLAYSRDGKMFYYFISPSRVYNANTDRSTVVKHFLSRDIVGQAVRVYPTKWSTAGIAMRMELYGCQGTNPKLLGCFVEGTSGESFDGSSLYISFNSPNRCTAKCFAEGYQFAALRRTSCICSSKPPQGAKSNSCNAKCTGDANFFCGGSSSVAFTVYETGLGPDDERCPTGYTTYRDKCFNFKRTKASWTASRDTCRAEAAGGDLATINSDADQAYLQNVIRSAPENIWIGLNDLQDQMSFDWSNGDPVLKTYWAHSEPNNWLGKNEDCVQARSLRKLREVNVSSSIIQSVVGLWNDAPCDLECYSLCQAKKTKIGTLPTTAPPPRGCPAGWKAYETSCYIMVEHYATWTLANTNCANVGGRLVRIEDEFEQRFITTELFNRDNYKYETRSTRYWTDMRLKGTTQEFVWSNDYDVITYTNWNKGQPMTSGSSLSAYTRCVALNGINEGDVGSWSTQSCYSGGYSLCERARDGYVQPSPPTLAPSDIDCPSGWIGAGIYCYQVNVMDDNTKKLSWDRAQQNCKDQGTSLATFSNGTDLEPLHKEIFKYNTWFWIGLNDKEKDKGYKWASGEPFSYNNWAQGEPNDWDGLEPCVVMNGQSSMWNDEKCHLVQNWICGIKRADYKKIQMVTTTAAPTPGPPGRCGSDDSWKLFHGRCYWLNTERLSFQKAEAACNGKGGNLASVRYEVENAFVQVVAKPLLNNLNSRTERYGDGGGSMQLVWLGLNELDRSKGHRWTDGNPLGFNRWAPNEPNDFQGGEYCVAMYAYTGLWNDEHCASAFPSVCEKFVAGSGPVTTTRATNLPGHCSKPGYVEFENYCYKAFSDTPLNKSRANQACRKEGGFLTSIQNNRDQAFLTSLIYDGLKNNIDYWIGLRLIAHVMTRAAEGTWDDNSDVTYTNWNHGEPNQPGQWNCVVMTPQNRAGSWEDRDCQTTNGYICKIPKDSKATTSPAPPTAGCDPGYILWNRACYKFVSQRGAWNYMDGKLCENGAHLLSIQSPFEEAFVRQWLWKQGVTDDIWIGLSSKPNTNTFSWSNIWPVVVTYWDQNEPQNTFSSGGCVIMSGSDSDNGGKWRHVDCNNMYSGICKKPLDAPPIKLPTSGICNSANGENWVAHTDGNCWLFWNKMDYDWDLAETACRTAGGNLASIHSEDDTNFIETYTQFDTQIGLSAYWIGLKKPNPTSGYRWTDNTGVYYTNWADKQPTSDGVNSRCVEMSSEDRMWRNMACLNKRGFICKIKQGAFPKTFPTPIASQPTSTLPTTARTSPCQFDGWTYNPKTTHCYLVVSDANELRHWQEALTYCQAPGREASLLHIGSADENQWVVDTLLPKVRAGTDVWMGFAELFTDNQFSWVNNEPINFLNWDNNQPNLNWGSMECTTMELNGLKGGAAGRWSTEYCFDKKPFICEIESDKKVIDTTLVPVTDGSLCHFPFLYRGQQFHVCTTYGTNYLWCALTDHYEQDKQFALCDPFRCPSGWSRFGQLCYYFSSVTDKLTWTDAEKSCDAKGADLAYIRDATAESFITNNIYEYFWIGLNDISTENGFVWDHHKSNTTKGSMFTNWGVNEPRDAFGTEDCVMIVNGPYADNRPGEWITGDCRLQRRYVCMMNATYTLGGPSRPTITSTIKSASSASQSVSGSSTTTTGGGEAVTPAAQSSIEAVNSLRTGEVVAIVIACCALVLAAVFIFLYIRRVRPTEDKGLGFSVNYSRNNDSVGLENPNFRGD